MMRNLLTRLPALLLASIVGLFLSSAAFGQTTIVIENGDAAGVGFNDATPAVPVGANGGTTLGQQRLIAFQAAANIWGAAISSSPTITIHASWSSSLACTATSGTLGSAGNSGNIWRDFPGSVPGFWYGNALANAISGTDRNGTSPEINAQFNLKLGNTGCLETLHWYYGLDGNHGSTGVDLVAVLMHEFAHGLGFQTFTNSSTGAEVAGVPSIYDRFLLDSTAGKTWAQMSDAERQVSAINSNKLVWNGPQVTGDVPLVLTGTPRLKVNSPSSIAGNYQVATADFGLPLSAAGITANMVQATPTDGCSTIGGSVSGRIALIDRGSCAFVSKVKNAQNAGAVGVIIADNVSASTPPGMGGSDPTITIPSVAITQADGSTIKAQLGSSVNATLQLDASSTAGADSLNRPLMYTPNPLAAGSSVSHWDTSESPNQLMEPNISNDLSHSVTIPQDLTLSLLRDIGWAVGSVLPAAPTVRLTATDYPIGESSSSGFVTVSVIREGDATSAATVNFATSDASSVNATCSQVTGKANQRCDYATSLGTLTWAAGESGTKSFNIPIINDAWVEGTETFNVTLSNPIGVGLGTSTATVTILDNDTTLSSSNPIDGVDFFITEQYIDFLGRMPDQGGFTNWQNTLAPCPNGGFGEPATSDCDRLHVAAGFFQSDEFLNRGYWAFRFYMVSYNQRPTYAQFIPDMAQVGGPKSPAQEESSKVAFADAYVQRPEFVAKYPGLSGQPLANALWQTAGLPGSPITAGILTKGQILRNIAETSAAFNQFLADGTVAIQYFGFLRRDPDTVGYQNNLATLRNDPNNLRHMIFIFIYSPEYRGRFGTP